MAKYQFTCVNGSTTKTLRFELDNYGDMKNLIEKLTDLEVKEIKEIVYEYDPTFPDDIMKNVNIMLESNNYIGKIYIPRIKSQYDYKDIMNEITLIKGSINVNGESLKKIKSVDVYMR